MQMIAGGCFSVSDEKSGRLFYGRVGKRAGLKQHYKQSLRFTSEIRAVNKFER